ncbi:MAG: hypothetical protein FWD68_14115 [Alphaproteobacteria bacterium]|nr:hypothetical protein [Alphaproteobacteria bacterium]
MNLIHLLRGGIPASFASSHDLENSLARLRAVTKASRWLYWPGGEAVVGEVAGDRVFLRRYRPSSYLNYTPQVGLFAPCFTGRFEHGDGGAVVLVGRFASHWSAYLSMTIQLGFLSYVAGMVAHGLFATGGGKFFMMLIITVLASTIAGSWWSAEDDIRCLRETMSSALAGIVAA